MLQLMLDICQYPIRFVLLTSTALTEIKTREIDLETKWSKVK